MSAPGLGVIHDSRALAEARAWIGTPYVRQGALCGVGADCIGLVRGVYGALMGVRPPSVPGWRGDWAADKTAPLRQAARRFLNPCPLEEAGPGCVVLIINARGLEGHAGILGEGGTLIHAVEGRGVVEVPLGATGRRTRFAAAFPGAPLPGNRSAEGFTNSVRAICARHCAGDGIGDLPCFELPRLVAPVGEVITPCDDCLAEAGLSGEI
ncbi:MAG: hypothetical protein AAF899_17690 [Pseudomonadota bacterium]